MLYPKLNSLLASESIKGTALEAEILELMKNQSHQELSLLEKTVAEFITAIESEGMRSGYSTPHKVENEIFSLDWCSNPNLISENFQVGEIHFSKVDTQNGTTEATMLETAVKGTMVEQIQRITQAILQKKLVRGMYAVAFIDEAKQKHPNGSALKLVCYCYPAGEVKLRLYQVHPAHRWYGADFVWFSSNKPSEI